MTAEDRNRRAKWGHDIPRSWISDFNMTHPTGRPQESEQELIERVRAKARRQRLEDLAAQRAAAQRSIEQTLVAGAACLVFLVGAVVVAVATWQQLVPPTATPKLQR
jgi:hypothetical protein